MLTDPRPSPSRWLNRTVLGAGLTSALGDLCYETATVILPGFLAVLGLPAAVLGVIEGIADATASLMKLVSGHVADRLGHRKPLVLVGYALTPVGQACIALAAGWPAILAGRFLSWFGKGLRGPLRDAIVVQSISAETRGRAFGFHRGMDTLGAVAGPLLGVGLLSLAQDPVWGLAGQEAATPFRIVLWLGAIPGVLAVLTFLWLVDDPGFAPNPALRLGATLRGLPARFRQYLGAVGLFGTGDFSHSLLILAATQLLAPVHGMVVAAQWAGLLYVGRNVVQVVLSWPIGALADRVGALPVLLAGYACGVVTAVLVPVAFLTHATSVPALAAIFFFAGLYVAVQEALESTVTAGMVDASVRATGFGALGAVNGVAKLCASSLVGVLWTVVSPVLAFGVAAALMLAGTFQLARVPR